MSSDIEICNRALSEIGTRSTIDSFDEGSAESINCAMWYDPCRKQLLRAAKWGFARGQVALSQLGSLQEGTSQYPWPFKYTYVSDMLGMRYLLPPQFPLNTTVVVGEQVAQWGVPCRANRFIIANDKDEFGAQRKVILSNLQQAQAVYTIDVTDGSIWDDLFEQALVSWIAAKIVIPLTGNKDMRSSFLQSASDAVMTARASDGNEAIPTTDSTPDWIAVRESAGEGYGDSLGFNQGNWYIGNYDISWGM